ncbi:helix-turn-helix domain-containing protein [Ralstonia solanacearum]|uniref:helix-turn-helix domain-containing protein n=1 Tax=Ralstonia solanacearum TaxID=305 RepID=UPI00399D6026
MNTHKNARPTLARRLEMVQDIAERGQSVPDAAARHGVTVPTARKWQGRYLAGGAAALAVKAAKVGTSQALREKCVPHRLSDTRQRTGARFFCTRATLGRCSLPAGPACRTG